MSEEAVMRKAPKQKRGQKRVEQILNAADRLIVLHGYAQVSTNEIAKEAKTSIGSLYQFFPNKDAVYLALAERYVQDLNALMSNAVSMDENAPPLPEQFDGLLDHMVDFYVQNPGFQPLFFGTYNTVASTDEIMCQMIDGMEAILIPLTADPPNCRLQAMVIMDTLKGTMPLIVSGDEAQNEAALIEIKKLLQGYLQTIIKQ